eukprot:CAMPEP_0194263516 /NCGR_PEP_ID=MMETSP0158-20130606/47098_1 /TAXON_ID=33649 /ORGANISM="Thalassionema nitzschioides, Strain L26-B" /LENGTH=293 /DNA_ID=CAMNT_0039003705 /DNA_START=65 /DNA_END=946 /DNA_ORIENTATION=-
MSGNTGISPFLTLFLMGVIEKSDETLLNMDGWMEKLLSSWSGLLLFGSLSIVELVGKCIPAVDEVIDAVEVFVVPVMSVFSTLGSVGLIDAVADAASGRRLGMGDAAVMAFKTSIVFCGVILSLLVHFCKMIMRLIGLATCAGFCQPCITIMETTSVVSCVMLAIFVRKFAIVTAIVFFLLAGYAFKKKFMDKKKEEEEEPAPVVDHYVLENDDGHDEEMPNNNNSTNEKKDEVNTTSPPTAACHYVQENADGKEEENPNTSQTEQKYEVNPTNPPTAGTTNGNAPDESPEIV